MGKKLYDPNIARNKKILDIFQSNVINIEKNTKISGSVKKEADNNELSMEDAIEKAGFGLFQIKLIGITGFAYVCRHSFNRDSINFLYAKSRKYVADAA